MMLKVARAMTNEISYECTSSLHLVGKSFHVLLRKKLFSGSLSYNREYPCQFLLAGTEHDFQFSLGSCCKDKVMDASDR